VGLLCILSAPFIHVNWWHFLNNVFYLLLIGFMIILRRISDYFWVWGVSQLVGGFGVWLISPSNTYTLGASGICMGMLAAQVVFVIFNFSFRALLWNLLFLGSFLASSIMAILPGQTAYGYKISWQGHLFGMIGGAIAGVLMELWYRRYPLNEKVTTSVDVNANSVDLEDPATMTQSNQPSSNPFDTFSSVPTPVYRRGPVEDFN
jgi:membrane associated rhomboid family serine protease